MHQSLLYLVVIDVTDLDRGVEFWRNTLGASEDPSAENDETVYKRLRIPGLSTRVLLQKVPEEKQSKNHLHIDIATSDVEAEADRIERLGATKLRCVQERLSLWVLKDPFGNEFCVVPPEHPEALEHGCAWS